VDTDDRQFRAFFDAYYVRLRDLGFLLSGSWAEGEELAQDAMVRTLAAWPRIRDPARAGAYARSVLVNQHRNVVRRTLTHLRHQHRLMPTEPPPESLPADARLDLQSALSRLPARQRAVLVLRYFEDLTETEVARLLGIPLGTVKSLNRRGLRRLREPDVTATQLTGMSG